MLAHEGLREGRLEEALAELQAQVRKAPGDPQLRIFLFQLLAVLGRWDRSLTQLQAVGQLQPGTSALVGTYRLAIAAESARASVFRGEARPQLVGEPEPWMAWLLEALRLTAAGEHTAASDLRARAFEAAPATPGTLDGAPFAWIGDADARLGPMLEVILNGRYAWLPFHRLRALRFEPPADLRDLVWAPVFLTLETGAELPALVPARYEGSEAAQDALRLSRRTEWRELGAGSGCWAGAGQRMLATDAGEHALLELRAVQLGDPAAPARDAAAPAAEDGARG